MPSDNKYTKKKPTAKARGGLYKPGEEIKPQRRPQNLFKGMPEVQRKSSIRSTAAGESSSMRRSISKDPIDPTRRALASERALKLYDQKGKQKYKVGSDKEIPKEIKTRVIKKLNKDMNRLRRAVPLADTEIHSEMDRTKVKNLLKHNSQGAPIHPHEAQKSSIARRLKKLLDRIDRGMPLKRTPVRGSKMYSPVGALIELGVHGYSPDKSTKKIKKLRKQAVST